MYARGSRFHTFHQNGMLNQLYKQFIYIQTAKLHFKTKYNFHQNKMAMVLHDIKIGHCMPPTLMMFNSKLILVDSACMKNGHCLFDY